jgi:four helix bundle protein
MTPPNPKQPPKPQPGKAPEPLIPPHGGYRHLKSFQVAQLVYDVTVRFCDRYIDRRSRTHDQMVQAARSGVQNIAEGSQASGTSKKMELKLTNVARASLEELRLDYEDFLRQRGLVLWERSDPRGRRLVARRCTTLDEVGRWVEEERRLAQQARQRLDKHRRTDLKPSLSVESVGVCAFVRALANAALSLLNLACATSWTAKSPRKPLPSNRKAASPNASTASVKREGAANDPPFHRIHRRRSGPRVAGRPGLLDSLWPHHCAGRSGRGTRRLRPGDPGRPSAPGAAAAQPPRAAGCTGRSIPQGDAARRAVVGRRQPYRAPLSGGGRAGRIPARRRLDGRRPDPAAGL